MRNSYIITHNYPHLNPVPSFSAQCLNSMHRIASTPTPHSIDLTQSYPHIVSYADTEIVASKSSEMNLSWPDKNGDMMERPIPEQYKHHIKGLTVTAEVSDLYTH